MNQIAKEVREKEEEEMKRREEEADDSSRTTLGESEDPFMDDSQPLLTMKGLSGHFEDSYDCVGYAAQPATCLLDTEMAGTKTAAMDKAARKPKKKKGSVKSNAGKENVVPITATQPKNWPHMRALVSENVLLIILNAVDECDCTSELAASNTDNPKGNKWTRLYDHCYGGVDVDDSNVHGLLGNRWRVLPNATKLKQKIQDIWAYIKKEKDSGKIPLDVVGIAMRQMEEYEVLKEKDKEATAKAKDKDARLQQQMAEYSKKVGAIPPGAKGDKGAGRREHSTNLVSGEPALFSYSNSSTAVNTPNNKSTKTRTVASSSTKSSGTSSSKPPSAIMVNNEAMGQVSNFTSKFEKMFDRHFGGDSIETAEDGQREKKRRRLMEAKKNHMETIQFLKDMTDDVSVQTYKKALFDFRAVCEQITQHDKMDGVKDSTTMD
jgi:hypothetical protein